MQADYIKIVFLWWFIIFLISCTTMSKFLGWKKMTLDWYVLFNID